MELQKFEISDSKLEVWCRVKHDRTVALRRTDEDRSTTTGGFRQRSRRDRCGSSRRTTSWLTTKQVVGQPGRLEGKTDVVVDR